MLEPAADPGREVRQLLAVRLFDEREDDGDLVPGDAEPVPDQGARWLIGSPRVGSDQGDAALDRPPPVSLRSGDQRSGFLRLASFVFATGLRAHVAGSITKLTVPLVVQ